MVFASKKKMLMIPRGIIKLAEWAIGIFLVLAVIIAVFFYTLAQGPLDLAFARTAIEESLSDPKSGLRVHMGDVHAEWGGAGDPVMLRIKDLQMWENDRSLVEMTDLSVSVATLPLLIGLVRPEHIIVRSPLMTFERSLDRQFHFVGAPQPGFSKTPAPPSAQDLEGFMIGLLKGDKRSGGVLDYLEDIEIRNARIRMVDHVMGMTWQITDVTLTARMVDVGVYGTASIQLPEGQQFTLRLIYNKALDKISLTSTFDKIALSSIAGRIIAAPWLRRQQLPLTGILSVEAHTNPFDITKFDVKAQATHGHIFMPKGTQIVVRKADIDAGYDRGTQAWTLRQMDIASDKLNVTSKGTLETDNTGKRKGVWHISSPVLTLDTLANLWPEDMRDTPFGEWMTKKLSKGTLRNIQVDIPLEARNAQFDLVDEDTIPRAVFDFDNLTADYRTPLTPVEKASGKGVYEADVLTIDVEKGAIKDLIIQPSQIKISDLQKKGAGHADLDIRIKGPAKTIFEYIALDPIRLGDKLPFSPVDVQGEGDYHIVLSFPTLRDLLADQMDVDVQATLKDMIIPSLVKGQTLSGGPFDLMVADSLIKGTGTGYIGGRPIQIKKWEMPLRLSKNKDRMIADVFIETDKTIRKAFGADIPFLEGPATTHVMYRELSSGDEQIDIGADLTSSRLSFSDIEYRKQPGAKATATARLIVEKGILKKAKDVTLFAPDFKIEGGLLAFGRVQGDLDITGAEIPSFSLARSNASVSYVRTENHKKIVIKGDKFDLVPFLEGEERDDKQTPALDLLVKVNKLYFGVKSPALEGADFRIKFNQGADLATLGLFGRAGAGTVDFRYMPNESGKMTLDLQAADAGAFLQTMGVYDNMKGGTLSLRAHPTGESHRDVGGDLVIRDFTIMKAPVLAQLIGAISLGGLVDQLGNKGIAFSRLQSGFSWKRSPGVDVMHFSDGRTSGSALGLTFGGIYDRKAKTIDIDGTIIPVSELNTLTSKIPLIGRLLAGGKNSALFAATYSIKGKSADPKTGVNPLSVLTPGILRSILFEDTPKERPEENQRRPYELNQ